MKNKIEVGQKTTLDKLIIGQKAKVLSLQNENKALRRRLLDMGITKDVVILIKKIAPLGDPIDIELRGYELCLRLNDMKNIDVEVIE